MRSDVTHNKTTSADRGAILPIVLILVVVLALVVVAIASYAAAALRSTRVTDNLVSRLTAAESGMQFALADAAATPGTCDGSSVTRGSINGASIETTCRRVPELENLAATYAVVLTGEGPGGSIVSAHPAIEVNGANSDLGVKDISGPVWFGAPGGSYLDLDLENARAVLPDPYSSTNVVSGIVNWYPSTGLCSTAPFPTEADDWTGTPLRPPLVACTERNWIDVAPTPDLTGSDFVGPSGNLTDGDLSVLDPAPDTTDPNCHVFFPGRYSVPPVINAPSFFKSGVYYFGGGEIEIDENVVVGKRTGGEFPDSTEAGIDAACKSKWDLETDTSGTVWILGNDARVYTQGPAVRLAFYGRAVLDTGSDPELVDRAIIALTQAQAQALSAPLLGVIDWATLPITGSVTPAPPKLIDRSNGGNTSMSFYGQVYAPNSWIDTGVAASDVFVEFLNGIVGGRIFIKTAANVDGFNISVPTSVINAFYVESTATLDGQATVRTRSVEEVDVSTGNRFLSVDSWRVCERGSC